MDDEGNKSQPFVSVVIPTRNRPGLLIRAVGSALNQTLDNIEVLVVIDGPSPETVRALKTISDDRLIIIQLPTNKKTPAARDEGIRCCNSPWIAFLDDDDLWFPDKLELQLATALASPFRYPIVTCNLIGRTPTCDKIWPRRRPRYQEPLSEYLICRKDLFWGSGIIQTSVIFAPRSLLKMVPFQGELVDGHEDLNWLMRANAVEGAAIQFVETARPLAIWDIDPGRNRISTGEDWRHSYLWITKTLEDGLCTPKAYISFLLTWTSTLAARQGTWKAMPYLWARALRHGRPTLIDVLVFFGNWLIPSRLQEAISSMATGKKEPCRNHPN